MPTEATHGGGGERIAFFCSQSCPGDAILKAQDCPQSAELRSHAPDLSIGPQCEPASGENLTLGTRCGSPLGRWLSARLLLDDKARKVVIRDELDAHGYNAYFG